MQHSSDASGQRLSKIIAQSGICSRRAAETLIQEGRVQVNDVVITTLGTLVLPTDRIIVDGRPLTSVFAPKTRIWLYYKPLGEIVSHDDPEKRPTVFDAAKKSGLPRVISVGRLDLNSEGLLLLTNDGHFSRYAELPKTGWKRTYRVRVFGSVSSEVLENLQKGCVIDGMHYLPFTIEESDHRRQTGLNRWLLITLTEGKNREVRKLMEFVGLKVNRLIRVSYGPFSLDTLNPGQIKEVPQAIVQNVYKKA